jgi:hypothetical protein
MFAGIEGQKSNATSGNYGGDLVFKTRLNGGNLTERMRITSTGVMYLGALATNFSFTNGSAVDISGSGTGFAGTGTNLTLGVWNGPIIFQAGNSAGALVDRARIDSSGNLLVGATSAAGRLTVSQDSASNSIANFVNNQDNPTAIGLTVNFSSGTGTNNTTAILFQGRSAGTERFYVYGNGNVVNANNSYGSISDIKLKENIVDATPKLEKLLQVRIVNYNLKADLGYESHKQIGVIAQELEQVFPGLVDESPDRDEEGNDLKTTTKSVKMSVFVPMLIKAIQEQQALITTLTARITALEGA